MANKHHLLGKFNDILRLKKYKNIAFEFFTLSKIERSNQSAPVC
jgi:hypothetical protein